MMDKDLIALPDPPLFETKIPVQIGQINYGNHVGYDAMVSLLHEAQLRFLQQQGYTEIDIDGVALVVQKLEVIYKKEATYGEILKFIMGIGELGRVKLDFLFSVINESDAEVCRARTTVVFVDPTLKKLVSTPAFFKDLKSGD